jgi:hypothetical protein
MRSTAGAYSASMEVGNILICCGLRISTDKHVVTLITWFHLVYASLNGLILFISVLVMRIYNKYVVMTHVFE